MEIKGQSKYMSLTITFLRKLKMIRSLITRCDMIQNDWRKKMLILTKGCENKQQIFLHACLVRERFEIQLWNLPVLFCWEPYIKNFNNFPIKILKTILKRELNLLYYVFRFKTSLIVYIFDTLT